MARGKPVEIATRSFATQAEAVEHFKAMLARYRPGEVVSGDDHLDLSALIERHHEYVLKVGCGVAHFTTMVTEHGTRCFRIERTDGTGTDVSYREGIRSEPPPRKREVSQAFRWAVRIDLFGARDRFFAEHRDTEGKVTCAVTGERISRDEAHMDHRPPMTFEVIVTTFLGSRGMALEDVPITAARDNQVSAEITDEALREAFRDFHRRVALLDIVRKSVNLRQATPNRIKSGRVKLAPPPAMSPAQP